MTYVPGESQTDRPLLPKRVRGGLKIRGNEGPVPKSWLTIRWVKLIEELVVEDELIQAKEYARLGQTISVDISPGLIEAKIQGRSARPYVTRLHFPQLSEQQWQQVIDAMAFEAVYAAKLLADELPQGTQDLFDSLGLQLIPPVESIRVVCDCLFDGPCKHAATAGYLIMQQLDSEPLLILTLRGLSSEHVVERITQARAIHSHGQAAAHPDPVLAELQESAPALDQCLEEFWRPGPQLSELEHMPPPQHAPHALLRRLGPSPLGGKFPLVGLLASIYDTVSQAAIKLRDHAERIDQEES